MSDLPTFTRRDAAWLIAPVAFLVAMNVPIPGVDAEALADFTHGGPNALLGGLVKVMGVATLVLAIVWGIGTAKIVRRLRQPATQSL